MKKLIIHIGYPKTATTTIEESLFVGLHNLSFINYLGRADFTDNPHPNFTNAKVVRDYLFHNIKPYNTNFDILMDKLNILSDDTYTHPGTYKERALKIKVNPFEFPKKLEFLFKDKVDCLEILVTLRSQQSLIYSMYVEKYKLFVNDRNNNTPTKHMFANNLQITKDIFNIYYFSNVLHKYAECFGKDKINVLLFEDLLNDRVFFEKQLADIIGVDIKTVNSLLGDKHYRQKKKTEHGYVQEIKKQSFAGQILLRLNKSSIVKKSYNGIKKKYGDNNLISQLLKNKLTASRSRSIVVPKLLAEQKDIIYNEFRENNLKLVSDFGVNYDKLKAYKYI